MQIKITHTKKELDTIDLSEFPENITYEVVTFDQNTHVAITSPSNTTLLKQIVLSIYAPEMPYKPIDSPLIPHIPHMPHQYIILPNPSPHQLVRLNIIYAYIHEHYMDKITLEDLAATIRICKSECCRLFKSATGESLIDYILRYRIQMSLTHLTTSQDAITEVASTVGFPDPCYFSRVFKKHMGCSPKEYRKMTQVPSSSYIIK